MDDVWFGSDLTHRDVEPVLRALSLHGRSTPPLLAFGDRDATLVMASRIFFSFFGVSDGEELAARLLAGRDPGSRRLATLCRTLAINGAPRLERLRFSIGPASEVVTFLCRRVLAEDQTPLFVAAALGLYPVTAATPDQPTSAISNPPEIPVSAQIASVSPVSAELSAGAERGAAQISPSGKLAPEAMTFQTIQAMLRTRWPANRSIRFLWQTDADMVCTQVSAPLADVVGAANAALVGRDLLELASRLDQKGRLGAALAGKTTWSGINVPWPIGDAPAAVEVALGAIPAFDRDKLFDGFRGYGVIRLDRVLSHAVTRLTEAASDTAVSAADNVVTFPGPRALSLEDEVTFNVLGLELRGEVGDEPKPGRAVTSGDGHAALSSAIVPVDSAPPSVAAVVSGSSGRLARSSEALSPVTAAPSTDRIADIGRNGLALLDRLATGLLVSRDNIPIFANRHLLDLTGFADEDALHSAGGMAHLFGDVPGNASGAETIGLRGRRGNIIPVIARMQRIAWNDLPASLLTLSSIAEPATAPSSEVGGAIVDSLATPETVDQIKSIAPVSVPDASELRELRVIVEMAADGIVIVDADRNVLSLNQSGEALFGCDRSEIIGKPFLDLFPLHSQSLAAGYLNGLRSSSTKNLPNQGLEILVKAPHGGAIPVLMRLGRLGDLSAGGPNNMRVCALFRDLSRWEKVEQDLDGARQTAERASALKTEFLAKVSHEVRTPIDAIIRFEEAMVEERFGPVGNERYQDYARNIQTSGKHVAGLVNDLLDISKIEAGKTELALDPLDVNKIVSESVALMQPQANRERVIMRLSLAPNLPRIKADERSLRQIVQNILSNSVKFNDPGGQVIVATAVTEAGCVVIRIRDTGYGMSEAEIAAAMELFRQLATGRSTVDGTELGLPSAKALVEANEASFSIRSKVDQGTLIEVSFPAARVLADHLPPQKNAERNA